MVIAVMSNVHVCIQYRYDSKANLLVQYDDML